MGWDGLGRVFLEPIVLHAHPLSPLCGEGAGWRIFSQMLKGANSYGFENDSLLRTSVAGGGFEWL